MNLDLSRVRRPSRRFGWIDRRIVTDGHLADLGPADVSVYLMLCLVADRHGVSWHADRTLSTWVKHPPSLVRDALNSLARRNLVAIEDRYVQVLDLDLLVPGADAPVRVPVADPPPSSAREDAPREPAGARLARLPTEVRRTLEDRARARLIRFTHGREPIKSVVEALAAGLLDEEAV
jgi:hypothetical protein